MSSINAVVILLAFLSDSPTNEWAYGHWNHMVYITRAFAVQERCPRLKVNSDVLTAVAQKYRIRLAPGTTDFAAMTKMMDRNTSWLPGQSTEAMCVLGVDSFGPNGALVKDLLIEK